MKTLSQLWSTNGNKNDPHSQPPRERASQTSSLGTPGNTEAPTNAEEPLDGSVIFDEQMEKNFQRLIAMRYGNAGANEYRQCREHHLRLRRSI